MSACMRRLCSAAQSTAAAGFAAAFGAFAAAFDAFVAAFGTGALRTSAAFNLSVFRGAA